MPDEASFHSSVPAVPERGSSAPPASNGVSQRIAVVVNGNAKNATQEVISTLHRMLSEGGDLFVSRRLEDAREIARTLVSRGYGTVLTGGGDGTFTVMVTEVVKEARRLGRQFPRFGLLKLGTGNALAWVVGAREPKGKTLAADITRLARDAGSRPMRLVEVEGFIAPFCGFGADADVLEDYAWVKEKLLRTPLRKVVPGPLGYGVAAVGRSIPSYVLKKKPHCRITNRGGEAQRLGAKGAVLGPPIGPGETLYEGPMRLCALSTIPYYGYGLRLFPFAEERTDRMHLRVATLSAFQFVTHFRDIWRGNYDNQKVVHDFLVEEVSIEINPAASFQIGGDLKGSRSHVDVSLTPVPIRLVDFYAPPSVE